MVNTRNAWIVIEPQPSAETPSFPGWVIAPSGSPNLFSAIAKDDWILVVTPTGDLVRTGRVFRLRADTNGTTVYFDRLLAIDEPVSIRTAGLSLPEKRLVGRLQWERLHRSVTETRGEDSRRYPADRRPEPISGSCCNWPSWTTCSDRPTDRTSKSST